MYRFIETLAVQNGAVINWEYHLNRFSKTYSEHWEGLCPYSFEREVQEALKPYSISTSNHNLWKLRLLYDAHSIESNLFPYKKRDIRRLIPVFSDTINYSFKSEDRVELNNLKKNKAENEEILIVKNGWITDTSYTNVVLFDGELYITPDTPLLPGTRRASLLDRNLIIERPVKYSSLEQYKEIHLINAFMGLGDCVIKISEVSSSV